LSSPKFTFLYNIRNQISFLLLLISGLFFIPQELIHEFTDHRDSIDYRQASTGSPVLGMEHHHCDALQLYIPPYTPGHASITFSAHAFIIVAFSFLPVSFPSASFSTDLIRGPPSC
jgi:hypothetical protein